jgi:hypothetical protein
MPIPKGRPRPVHGYKRKEPLTDLARALIWALRHGPNDRPPCSLARMYQQLAKVRSARFLTIFFKHCPEDEW